MSGQRNDISVDNVFAKFLELQIAPVQYSGIPNVMVRTEDVVAQLT